MKEISITLPDEQIITALIDLEKDVDITQPNEKICNKPVILIYGPGSLLIQFFTKRFREENILIIFDDNWTSAKQKPLSSEEIEAVKKISLEDEALNINKLVLSLKEATIFKAIGILGFSSLAIMAIKIANTIPKNIDFIIAIGCPVDVIDKNFTSTLPLFLERNQSSDKAKLYQQDQAELALKLSTGDLSPNSVSMAAWLSMKARFFANPKGHGNSLENWRFGITAKIFDPTMREHFFDTLFPLINIKETMEQNSIPTLLFFGADDGIVPPSEEIIARTWRPSALYPENYRYHVYESCGHYAMAECSEQFEQDVLAFYKQRILPLSVSNDRHGKQMAVSSTGEAGSQKESLFGEQNLSHFIV